MTSFNLLLYVKETMKNDKNRMIIFSCFSWVLHSLKIRLNSLGVGAVFVPGTIYQRQKALHAFQEGVSGSM